MIKFEKNDKNKKMERYCLDVLTTKNLGPFSPQIEKMLFSLASSPNTSPDILDLLSTDTSEKILIAVAKNPNTSEETRLRLTKSSSPAVKAASASCPSSSKSLLLF